MKIIRAPCSFLRRLQPPNTVGSSILMLRANAMAMQAVELFDSPIQI
jgi:hypothetical protein